MKKKPKSKPVPFVEESPRIEESTVAAIPEIGAFAAKTHLSAILEKVAKGQTFLITKHGKAIAEIKPVSQPAKARTLGQWAHKKFYMAPDFDAPLEDFKDYM
jgi:antitoxin (DNA-binding transcriptional repressor) of toxin-antitoxin stability system